MTLDEALESRDFYEVMQVYRWDHSGTGAEQFEAVKAFLRNAVQVSAAVQNVAGARQPNEQTTSED